MDIAILAAVCLGISEVIKQLGVPSRFIPVVSLLVGVSVSFLSASGITINMIILNGIIAGLTASGFWSGAKAVAGK